MLESGIIKTREYQQCTRCVMDTSDLEIGFDESGNCNHCVEFLNRRIKYVYQDKASDLALEKLVEEIKQAGKNKEYDCILGVSGGVDSSYLSYIAKQKGLRVLAVHMDNGWNSEAAVLNIKHITSKLNIDYESFVLDWEEFRDLQLAFLKASIPEADTPTDIAIPAVWHLIAAKYGIKHILSGGNVATEGILPRSWHYNAKDMKYFNHIQKTFGTRKLKKFPTFGFQKEMYHKLVKGIKITYMLSYVPYEKKAVIKLLQDKLDLRFHDRKHHESKYTGFIQSYYLYKKFGIDYRRATLSSQICIGKVKREEVIDLLSEKPYDVNQIEADKVYIAKKLHISDIELDRIIDLPAKYFWDYPNDKKKLKFIYDLYRKLYKKEKLGSF
jgi:N-acetyl sugar amidotransferase